MSAPGAFSRAKQSGKTMSTKRKKAPTTEDILKQQEAQAAKERNAVATRSTDTALASNDGNAWLEVAAELDRFVGAPFLKFNKQGEYAISDAETIPIGTRGIAHCSELCFGWRKWEANKVVEERMGRVADRFVPPARGELGDSDESKWEMQDDGTRRDPWQFTATVPFTRSDTDASYVFSVTSRGGLRAINGLVRAYGSRVKDKGDAAGDPIVELQSDSYKHRTYGKIFFPLLHVVGWTDAGGRPLSTKVTIEDQIPW
jgi:hypothetical protein